MVKKKVKFDESLESSIYDKFDDDNVVSVADPDVFKRRYLIQNDYNEKSENNEKSIQDII